MQSRDCTVHSQNLETACIVHNLETVLHQCIIRRHWNFCCMHNWTLKFYVKIRLGRLSMWLYYTHLFKILSWLVPVCSVVCLSNALCQLLFCQVCCGTAVLWQARCVRFCKTSALSGKNNASVRKLSPQSHSGIETLPLIHLKRHWLVGLLWMIIRLARSADVVIAEMCTCWKLNLII